MISTSDISQASGKKANVRFGELLLSKGLLNQRELAEALNEGRLAGAGLDVLCTEPPPADNPLLNARNCCITPHIAWATKEARERLMNTSVENVQAFLSGAPQNVVNRGIRSPS